jgi:predicted nucleic acid-binding protein
VKNPLVRLLISELNLGKGEAEVIALASETGIKTIIDDLKARQVAEKLGIKVTGTIGILIKAEKARLINNAYEKAKELREKGFYVSDELLDEIKKFLK